MNILAFIVFGVLGASLLVLVFNGNDAMIGPMTDEQFAGTVYLGLLATVLAAGLFASGQRFGRMAQQAGIWIALLVILVVGYEYRFELQETASRVTSSLVPGQAVTTTSAEGDLSVTINRNGRHFEVVGSVNGARQPFMIDTGASTIVLTQSNARRAGYDPEGLSFQVPVATANGTTLAARISGVDITVGGIERQNMVALVARDDQLDTNLLGMNFLDTLSSFEFQRDRMILRN
ncbi:TIGR02281 family clan AA aspartic protease [Oricola sp.]|uniref:TIGR02281 family clan AA aspartic protease n=1 Tax=Oricola sp. TaxID=1979950 RepID=UPI0025F86125|nr:TIGR02281 family clan AA aspartic protease [Oricola sp.]MCI5077323.1 TIGR02281 family clan AA aspartic protease [Oricola sp.]